MAEAISDIGAEPGRGRAVPITLPDGGHFTLLDDAYNANPVSMAAAIASLGAARPTGAGRRIAVLGDMLELGPDENRLHAALAEPLAEAGVDAVITCGRRMKSLHDALPSPVRAGYAQDALGGLEHVKSLVRSGDVVLIKGSNGSGLHKIASVLVDGTAFGLTEA